MVGLREIDGTLVRTNVDHTIPDDRTYFRAIGLRYQTYSRIPAAVNSGVAQLLAPALEKYLSMSGID